MIHSEMFLIWGLLPEDQQTQFRTRERAMIPKPYFLFAGDTYYPRGGLDELIGQYASLEEAKAQINLELVGGYNEYPDWAEIGFLGDDGVLVSVAHTTPVEPPRYVKNAPLYTWSDEEAKQ